MTAPLRLALSPFSYIEMDGYRMELDFRDNASFKYWSDRRGYEAAVRNVFLSFLANNPGSVAIDLGANYGSYTLAAAQLKTLGVIDKVIAIEPDARPFAAIKRSLEKNRWIGLVDLYRTIVSDREGSETLFLNSRSSADNRSHKVTSAPIRCSKTEEVPCTTIDHLLDASSTDLTSRFVIKMDIQGNEVRGAGWNEKGVKSRQRHLPAL